MLAASGLLTFRSAAIRSRISSRFAFRGFVNGWLGEQTSARICGTIQTEVRDVLPGCLLKAKPAWVLSGLLDELLVFIERSKARTREFRLLAGWVETDEVFVQLLCMGDVVLPVFELGGLEQLLGFVAGTAQEQHAVDGTE